MSAASRFASCSPGRRGRTRSRSPARSPGPRRRWHYACPSTIARWQGSPTRSRAGASRASPTGAPTSCCTALDLADELKVERARRRELRILPGRTVGLIFRKPSTRTRISSEVGIAELGGMALYVPAADLQLSRGESTRDTALVLSRFLSAITIRTFDQTEVDEFAEHATIPIVNGLTDTSHPLQALADAMTIRERFGTLEGVRVAYLGDGNNVCHSLMRIAARTGMHLVAASPEGYLPDPAVVASCREDAAASGASIDVVVDPVEAVAGRRGALHGRLDEHGPGGRARAAAPRPRAVPHRRREARSRGAGRDRAPLPARTRRRGDHRGRPLRRPLARLGPGREPPPRLQGRRSRSRCDEIRRRRPRGARQPAARHRGRAAERRRRGRGRGSATIPTCTASSRESR